MAGMTSRIRKAASSPLMSMAALAAAMEPIGATLKGFESNAWFGLFGPSGLPAEVTARLHEAAHAAVKSPAFQRRLETDGARPVTMAPDAFSGFVVEDVKRWAEVIRFSGATVE